MPGWEIGKTELKSLLFPLYTDPELTEKVKKTIYKALPFQFTAGNDVSSIPSSKKDTKKPAPKHNPTTKPDYLQKSSNMPKKPTKKVEAEFKHAEPPSKKYKTGGFYAVNSSPRVQLPLRIVKQFLNGCQWKLPRFLFRGFHSNSGGGHDPRLNSKKGITPHGFLQGLTPSGMYATPTHALNEMIDAHLQGSAHIQSYFSSWSADLATALHYCVGRDAAHVAVLDTRLLAPPIEVHHTIDLFRAVLCGSYYEEEWLAYGPISGRAFHCVANRDLAQVGFATIFTPPSATGSTQYIPMPPAVTAETAKKVAKLFQYQDDDGTSGLVISVAAAILGIHYTRQGRRSDMPVVVQAAAQSLSQELKQIRRPPLPCINKGLVNPMTYSEGLPALEFMINLLVNLEEQHVQPDDAIVIGEVDNKRKAVNDVVVTDANDDHGVIVIDD